MNVKRKQQYLNYFSENSTATWKELSKLVNVSEITIRRDMKLLENNGLVIIGSGGVSKLDSRVDIVLDSRQKLNSSAKNKIAKKAATKVKDNDTIYIDAGSTTELLLKYITAKNILVVTNAINVAIESSNHNFETIILGGKIKNRTLAATGEDFTNKLDNLYFDKSFMGANGISKENGLSTPDSREAKIKAKVIKRSNQKFVLIDSTKFNKPSLVKFADIDEVEIISDKVFKK